MTSCFPLFVVIGNHCTTIPTLIYFVSELFLVYCGNLFCRFCAEHVDLLGFVGFWRFATILCIFVKSLEQWFPKWIPIKILKGFMSFSWFMTWVGNLRPARFFNAVRLWLGKSKAWQPSWGKLKYLRKILSDDLLSMFLFLENIMFWRQNPTETDSKW